MKRYHDWYKLQKDCQGWDAIQPDVDVVNMVSQNHWCLNLDHCHQSLKSLLEKYHVPKSQVDFFVITDPELSKFPLDIIFKLVEKQYTLSSVGGYMACLSYYLNSRKKYTGLGDSYNQNIKQVFEQELSFAVRVQCHSQVLDRPIDQVVNGQLVEGSNFIFVHPNIRYFLWKR